MPQASANTLDGETFTQEVFIVDDDLLIRESLSLSLQAAGYQVTTFASAEAFLDVANPNHTRGCLVCDLRLPGMSGAELLEELNRRGYLLPSIVITGYGDVSAAVRVMRAGALNLIEKPFQPDEATAAVRAAFNKGPPLNALRVASEAAWTQLATLTAREREVFDLVVAGLQAKQIAQKLGMSHRTVEIHRANVMRRLNERSIPKLVRLSMLASMKYET